ncbi:MAG: thioredoxin [Chloroflexi bacterium]|nr:thioredoxin [Chloroflexota bacterium]
MAKPFEVTDETFEEKVLKAKKPVLVDFWAEWCGPCKAIAPAVEAIADEYKDRLQVAKMDVDTSTKTPGGLGIRGIPTLILFKGGAEVKRIVGNRSKEKLIEELLPHI